MTGRLMVKEKPRAKKKIRKMAMETALPLSDFSSGIDSTCPK
jgi:hypothetical protein